MSTLEVRTTNLNAAVVAERARQLVSRQDAVAGSKTEGELLTSPDGSAVIVVAPEGKHEHWRSVIVSMDVKESAIARTYASGRSDTGELARQIEATVASSSNDIARWSVVENRNSGTLMVVATPSEHEQIAALLDRIESAPSDERRAMRVFKIKNRSVNDLLGVLQAVVATGTLDETAGRDSPVDRQSRGGDFAGSDSLPRDQVRSSSTSGTAPRDAESQEADNRLGTDASRPLPATRGARLARGQRRSAGDEFSSEPEVVLTADEGTSAIVAVGEPRVLSQIERLIQQLDVRQPQVLVQAVVVSLSDSQSRDLGIELEGQINLSADSLLRLSSLFGLSAAGSQVGSRTSTGAGGTGLLLSPGEFAAVIRALESLNKGRSVSTPQVLVANNQQAVLNSVIEQPFQSVSTSNNVTTNSVGGSSSAGTVITARPQVADGDSLVLEYSIELSAFVGNAASQFVPPPRQTSNVSSNAMLPDGFAIAVGGLELTTEGETESRVPLLGSIPVLGEAFKSRSKSWSRNRFYVFLRADIMRHSTFEDLKYLSSLKAGASHANVMDGAPELEPRMIR